MSFHATAGGDRARRYVTDGAAGDVVELSNTWAAGPQADEVPAVLACAELLHPHRAVVGYTSDDTLGDFTGAGFEPVGPHVVWVREP